MAGGYQGRVIGTTNYVDATAANVIAAQGASTSIVVTGLIVTNSHSTVGTKVEIRDGTTVKIINYAAAGGGGFAMGNGVSPLFTASHNTAITARCVTTGADVDVTIFGFVV